MANVGDSRAVLGHNGRVVQLSHDHKPDRRDERRRIVSHGGKVKNKRVNGRLAVSRAFGDFDYKKSSSFGGNSSSSSSNSSSNSPVSSQSKRHSLTISSSSGQNGASSSNREQNSNSNNNSCSEQQVYDCTSAMSGIVIVHPEILSFRIEKRTDFIILACDGLWDVMSSDDAVRIVYHALERTRDLGRVCRYLVNLALRRGSRDNVTCMIVLFHEMVPKVVPVEQEEHAEHAQKQQQQQQEKQTTVDVDDCVDDDVNDDEDVHDASDDDDDDDDDDELGIVENDMAKFSVGGGQLSTRSPNQPNSSSETATVITRQRSMTMKNSTTSRNTVMHSDMEDDLELDELDDYYDDRAMNTKNKKHKNKRSNDGEEDEMFELSPTESTTGEQLHENHYSRSRNHDVEHNENDDEDDDSWGEEDEDDGIDYEEYYDD